MLKPMDLPGYEGCSNIVISYRFPDGVQTVCITMCLSISYSCETIPKSEHYVETGHLPGYEGCRTIVISYRFPDGIQTVSMAKCSCFL